LILGEAESGSKNEKGCCQTEAHIPPQGWYSLHALRLHFLEVAVENSHSTL